MLTAAPTTAALSSPGAPARPLWSDCLVLRLRSRLLAAQDDTPAAIAALAQAKKALTGWATAAAGGAAAGGNVPAGWNLDKLNAELAKVRGGGGVMVGVLVVLLAEAGSECKAPKGLGFVREYCRLPGTADTVWNTPSPGVAQTQPLLAAVLFF